MVKFSTSFEISVENKKYNLIPASYVVIASEHWYEDTIEFEYDLWEQLKGEISELEDLKNGIYHIFMYGNISEDWSNSYEFGREFNGFIFEPEITLVNLIKE